MGSIRSPLWRHGGTVHGPVPRSYAYKLPRKMALGALRSALSAKLRDGELKVVRAFDMNDHKTKSLVETLRTLEAASKVLLVDVIAYHQDGELSGAERNLTLASRNLQGVKLLPSREVTVYDLLAHKQVLISEAAARKLSEALAV
jgi:large subunit ribosomal protein L4